MSLSGHSTRAIALAITLAPVLLAVGGCAAQVPASRIVTTPEGAQLDADPSLAYQPGTLSAAQLSSSTRELMAMAAMNVFRRFPREVTGEMERFYTGALDLRSLSPLQLTASQQMILTGIGHAQIKLSAGQPPERAYHLEGGPTGGKGIRFFALTYPDKQAVLASFARHGFPMPQFAVQRDGTEAALVSDPGGFPVKLTVSAGARPRGDDGVGVGIAVTDLATSRAFYREFVGLDELAPIRDDLLGLTLYPYRNGETTLYLYQVATGPTDTGSAGIQYVVRDAAMVEAKRASRGIPVLTPLNRLRGFDLITVWLADPDGVTNYFAQPGTRTPVVKEVAPAG